MVYHNFLFIYLPTSASKARTKIRVGIRASKSLQKGGVGKSLFLIRALGRLLVSLLSARIAKGFCQKRELGVILMAWLSPKT